MIRTQRLMAHAAVDAPLILDLVGVAFAKIQT